MVQELGPCQGLGRPWSRNAPERAGTGPFQGLKGRPWSRNAPERAGTGPFQGPQNQGSRSHFSTSVPDFSTLVPERAGTARNGTLPRSPRMPRLRPVEPTLTVFLHFSITTLVPPLAPLTEPPHFLSAVQLPRRPERAARLVSGEERPPQAQQGKRGPQAKQRQAALGQAGHRPLLNCPGEHPPVPPLPPPAAAQSDGRRPRPQRR